MMRSFCAIIVGVSCLMAIKVSADDFKVANSPQPGQGKLRHVVLFKFKDGTATEQIKKIEDAFRALPSKISTIVEFEWGTNNSPENKAQGFTHCFFVTFHDAAGRDVYLPHPAHKEFGKLLHPHLDKVLVIDYDAQPGALPAQNKAAENPGPAERDTSIAWHIANGFVAAIGSRYEAKGSSAGQVAGVPDTYDVGFNALTDSPTLNYRRIVVRVNIKDKTCVLRGER